MLTKIGPLQQHETAQAWVFGSTFPVTVCLAACMTVSVFAQGLSVFVMDWAGYWPFVDDRSAAARQLRFTLDKTKPTADLQPWVKLLRLDHGAYDVTPAKHEEFFRRLCVCATSEIAAFVLLSLRSTYFVSHGTSNP